MAKRLQAMADRREKYDDPEEALRSAMEDAQANMWTALPATVTAVDLVAQTISAQPNVKGSQSKPDGSSESISMPMLVDVPICWPRAGGFAVTLPIKAGDEVLIVFASRAIDGWWQSGGEQEPVESRMHDLSDGFAIFAPTSQAKKLTNVQDDGIEIRLEDRSAFWKLDENGDIYSTFGTMYLTGDIVQVGNQTITGDTAQTGKIEATNDVKAATISLKNHGHFALDNVTPLTGKPIP